MVVVQIKSSSPQAKKLIEMLKTFPYVEILNKKTNHYSPKFVKKIKDAEKGADYKVVNEKDLWGSIK